MRSSLFLLFGCLSVACGIAFIATASAKQPVPAIALAVSGLAFMIAAARCGNPNGPD